MNWIYHPEPRRRLIPGVPGAVTVTATAATSRMVTRATAAQPSVTAFAQATNARTELRSTAAEVVLAFASATNARTEVRATASGTVYALGVATSRTVTRATAGTGAIFAVGVATARTELRSTATPGSVTAFASAATSYVVSYQSSDGNELGTATEAQPGTSYTTAWASAAGTVVVIVAANAATGRLVYQQNGTGLTIAVAVAVARTTLRSTGQEVVIGFAQAGTSRLVMRSTAVQGPTFVLGTATTYTRVRATGSTLVFRFAEPTAARIRQWARGVPFQTFNGAGRSHLVTWSRAPYPEELPPTPPSVTNGPRARDPRRRVTYRVVGGIPTSRLSRRG